MSRYNVPCTYIPYSRYIVVDAHQRSASPAWKSYKRARPKNVSRPNRGKPHYFQVYFYLIFIYHYYNKKKPKLGLVEPILIFRTERRKSSSGHAVPCQGKDITRRAFQLLEMQISDIHIIISNEFEKSWSYK